MIFAISNSDKFMVVWFLFNVKKASNKVVKIFLDLKNVRKFFIVVNKELMLYLISGFCDWKGLWMLLYQS